MRCMQTTYSRAYRKSMKTCRAVNVWTLDVAFTRGFLQPHKLCKQKKEENYAGSDKPLPTKQHTFPPICFLTAAYIQQTKEEEKYAGSEKSLPTNDHTFPPIRFLRWARCLSRRCLGVSPGSWGMSYSCVRCAYALLKWCIFVTAASSDSRCLCHTPDMRVCVCMCVWAVSSEHVDVSQVLWARWQQRNGHLVYSKVVPAPIFKWNKMSMHIM